MAGESEAEAFEALFAANYDDLLRYAIRRVGFDAAPDVVAEVMLVAWRRRGEYDPAGARLWLFGVAHHVIANERRSVLRRERLTTRVRQDAEIRPDPTEPGTDAERVRRALAMLSPVQQEALRLTEWERLSADEAAGVAGCSRATFRVRLHRARRRLAALLAEQDPRLSPRAVTETADTNGGQP